MGQSDDQPRDDFNDVWGGGIPEEILNRSIFEASSLCIKLWVTAIPGIT